MAFLSPIILLLQRLFYIALGIFGIGFLIGFHELGHFLFCKLFRVRTPSFSIGFGPKIFSRKIGDTEFMLSPIPLGGFVEIAGAAEMGQGEQAHAQSKDQYSFAIKPYYQKLLIMLGGIIFNLMFAYAVFIGLCFVGLPKSPILFGTNGSTKIKTVSPDSPAQAVGIEPGDIIASIDGVTIRNNTIKLIQAIESRAGQQVPIVVERNDETLTYQVTIGSREVAGKKVGSLGIECALKDTKPLSLFSSIKQGIHMTNQWIAQTALAFISIFKKGETEKLGGPIAVVSMTMKSASAGWKIFLLLLAIISINLAVLNLIPLPILDGGQILFYTIEAITGRPLPTKVREYIHMGSWFFILGLIILLSIRDVSRMASPAIEKVKSFMGILPK